MEYNNINNNNNNNNIYNKKTSISINTSTSYNYYLSKENYCNILYLLIKKEWTYFNEIKKLFNLTTNIYLPNLERKGIIVKRKPTEDEVNYITLLNRNIPKYKLTEDMIYEFSQEALQYYSQPKIYDILKLLSVENIDDYIILQQQQYQNKLLEQKQKEADEDRRVMAEFRRLNVITNDMEKQKMEEIKRGIFRNGNYN